MNPIQPATLAGRGARLGAAFIDIVFAGLSVLPGILIFAIADHSEIGIGMGIATVVIAWIALLAIQATFLIKRGQSVGKMALGIKIVRVSDGTIPGFVKIFLLRLFVPNLLTGIPFIGIAFILVDLLFIFREDRRCLHDLIAETKVIESANCSSAATAAPVNSYSQVATARANVPLAKSAEEVSQPPSPSAVQQQAVPLHNEPVIDVDAVYAIVANEMESGDTDKGLWTRLFAELDGDEKMTKIAYIKQRAEKLMVTESVRLQESERQRIAMAERTEKLRFEGLSLREKLAAGNITPELATKIKELSATRSAIDFLGAVRLNRSDLVAKMLDENPLYIGVTTSEGLTPLHISAAEKYFGMSKLLLQRGAVVDQPSAYGQTPVEIVNGSGRKDLLELFSKLL